jgi:hypothetical protein
MTVVMPNRGSLGSGLALVPLVRIPDVIQKALTGLPPCHLPQIARTCHASVTGGFPT